jgi:YD repeat-containing protein
MRNGPGRERARRDGGAAAIEYAALLVVASLLMTALLAFVPNPVEPEVRAALCRLFGGTDCTAGAYEYKPPASSCVVGSDSKKAGASVTVFSVKVGDNVQLVRTTYADGTVRMTLVPIDLKVGVETGVGGKVQVGKGGFGGDLGVKVEGSLNYKYGDTWVFPNGEAADQWTAIMQAEIANSVAEAAGIGGYIFDTTVKWLGRPEDDPRRHEPEISQHEIGVEGALKGAVGFGPLSADDSGKKKSVTDIGTGLDIEGSVGASVLVTNDNSGKPEDGYPVTSYTFQVKGSIKGGAKVLGYGPGGERSYTGQTKVTYDKDGRLKSITWVSTQETNDSEAYKNPGKANGSVKDTDKQVSVTTTTVNFDDSNRAIGENWLRQNAFLMPGQTAFNAVDQNGAVVTHEPGPNADPMDRLVYDQGRVTRNVYAGDVDETKVGISVAAEVKFGIEGGVETEEQKLVDSQYLGPPQNGQRTFQQWTECAGK